MTDIIISATKEGEQPMTAVQTPYHPDWAGEAKKLGGKWHSSTRTWVFDRRDEQRIRNLCRSIFGTDGSAKSASDVVTIRLEATAAHRQFTGGIYFAGRCLANAYGRDTGAKLGGGVILLAGSVSSGGSVKNWTTAIGAGTILEVRDLPIAAVPLDAEGWNIELLDTETEEQSIKNTGIAISVFAPDTPRMPGDLPTDGQTHGLILANIRSALEIIQKTAPEGWRITISDSGELTAGAQS